jgi:hypothetical protein
MQDGFVERTEQGRCGWIEAQVVEQPADDGLDFRLMTAIHIDTH